MIPQITFLGGTLFPLGRVVVTRALVEVCSGLRLAHCLSCHATGDWGITCDADKAQNDKALLIGERLVSAYAIDPTKPVKGMLENRLLIITEWDRSVTTLLLPSDY